MKLLLFLCILFLLSHSLQIQGKVVETQTEINFGFSIELFNDVDLNDALVAIQLWTNELVSEYNDIYTIKTKIYRRNNEIVEAYKENEIDLIAILSADYFKLLEQIHIKPLITSNYSGSKGIEYILLSRKEDKINSIPALKNKKIVFAPANISTIAEYWLKSKLAEIGERGDFSYLSNTSHAVKQSNAILSVFFKKYYACLVTTFSFETMIELNPQVGTELSIVDKSKPLINAIVCSRESLNHKITEDIFNSCNGNNHE